MSHRRLELLAPARNAEVGRVAILAGADAVYIGAPAFGARAAAGNSVADIAALCDFAHVYRARVYVTMNTILYDSELDEARSLVWQLYAAGVDALIVQDMAYLMMDLPPIALHASTQCDIRTPEKARWLARAGFAQLVLPREFTLDEIRACAESAGVPVEVFVHGALCVSYSGDCQAGFVATGRSANRGTCPQMCRLPYELVDAQGREVAPRKHYLSLRDMNQSAALAQLVAAGASSFKIEGRLKDARYVANVTRMYSRLLDEICRDSDGKYTRASRGTSQASFTPDLQRTFNRGYTSYFLVRPARMASLDTPKWAGQQIGTVRSAYDSRRRSFRASLTHELANGDGLGYYDRGGVYRGFRLNRVEGDILFPATPQADLEPGMKLYRNTDKAFFDILDAKDASCSRTISATISLTPVDDVRLSLDISDERGCRATLVADSPAQQSRSPQAAQRQRVLEKTGDTVYRIAEIDDNLGDRFVAASVLSQARRNLLLLLDHVAAATYTYDRRRACELSDDAFGGMVLTYHDNVANRLSRQFYLGHGAEISQSAIEVERPGGEVRVMQTRYCIRRELGACLREKDAARLPSPLFLRNESGLYRLDFDCARCGMNVIKTC